MKNMKKKCTLCGEKKDDVRIRTIGRKIDDDPRLMKSDDVIAGQWMCKECYEEKRQRNIYFENLREVKIDKLCTDYESKNNIK